MKTYTSKYNKQTHAHHFWLPALLVFFFLSACGSYRVLSHDPSPPLSRVEARPHLPPLPITQTPGQDYFKIQIALILDTSGSMENLLEQAKAEFWYLVDELVYAYRDYGDPILEIALLEYGNKDLGARNGYMRVVVPLTQELDWISSELYNLVSRGKHEYCGEAISLATEGLAWSEHPEDIQMIFIAGNESFMNGMTHPRAAISRAYEWGITVNTIFCGDYDRGIELGWEDGAIWGGGTYSAINMYQDVAWYDTPYDARICELNAQFNLTYIPYGAQGSYYWDRFRRQDEWAGRYGNSNLCIRTLVKSNYYYWNTNWDLVDAYGSGRVDCRLIPDEDWPRDLRRLSWPEREKVLIRKVAERERIRKELRELGNQRRNRIRIIAEKEEVKKNTVSRAIVRSSRSETGNRQPVSQRPQSSRRPTSRTEETRPERQPQAPNRRSSVSRNQEERAPVQQRDQSEAKRRTDQQESDRTANRLEQQRKEEAEARRRTDQQRAKREKARLEQQRQEEAEARRRTEQQRAERERARLEQQRQEEAEARRRTEQQRAERERARLEQQRQEEAEARRRIEQQRAEREKARLEQQRQEEAEARRRAEQQRAEREKARLEQQRQEEAEARRRTEQQRVERERARLEQQRQEEAEARRRADQQRAEQERARREQQQQEEARRRADQQRAEQEHARREQQRQEEARRRADQQRAEQERARREQQRQEEARRRADQQRAEQERARREQQRQEEARRRADQQRAEQERARREQQRQEEARRRADQERARQQAEKQKAEQQQKARQQSVPTRRKR